MIKSFKLAALRSMLWQMEIEFGLEDLSAAQKDVYYAACLVADEGAVVFSDTMKRHPLLAPMARPTFYRALKQLSEKGFLASIGSGKSGRYKINR